MHHDDAVGQRHGLDLVVRDIHRGDAADQMQALRLLALPRSRLVRKGAGLTQLLRALVVRHQVLTAERPAAVRHPVARLEVDGIKNRVP